MRTIVFGPPREMSPADDVVEDEPNDGPWHVVNGGRRRYPLRAVEDDGEVDIFEDGVGPLERDGV